MRTSIYTPSPAWQRFQARRARRRQMRRNLCALFRLCVCMARTATVLLCLYVLFVLLVV